MTQKSFAELYQKNVRTINDNIKNIYEDGELEEKATIQNNRIVRNEGNRRVSEKNIVWKKMIFFKRIGGIQ